MNCLDCKSYIKCSQIGEKIEPCYDSFDCPLFELRNLTEENPIYKKCFYCSAYRFFVNDGYCCIYESEPWYCEKWRPQKEKIVNYAKFLDISVNDLVTLLKL